MLKRILLTAFVAMAPSLASAVTYYVDVATGSNSDNGSTEALAWADPGYASTQMGDGDLCYVKAGTYTVTTTTVGAGGPVKFAQASKRARMEGYTTTPGDRCVGGSKPVISASASLNPASTCYLVEAVGTLDEPHVFVALRVDANSEPFTTCFKGASTVSNLYSFCYDCEAVEGAVNGFNGVVPIGCYAGSNTGTGFAACANASYSYAESNTSWGFTVDGNCVRLIARANGAGGVSLGYSSQCGNSVAYGNTGDGFAGVRNNLLVSCVAVSNTSDAFETLDHMMLINCADYNNTAGRQAATAPMFDLGAITLTGDPFVDAANDNFTPDATTSEGALLRNAGVNPYGHTGYLDAGAVQHEGSSGGGTDQVTITPFVGGDIQEDNGSKVFTFTTSVNGVATALSSGAIQFYVNGGSALTSGVTLASVTTGVYKVTVDSTNANFNGGGDVIVTLSAGTVGGISVVNRDVGSFSVGRFANVNVTSGVVQANAVQLSGDSTAADNAESFFDGTGYAGTGNTIPTVTNVTNTVDADLEQIKGDPISDDAAANWLTFFHSGGDSSTLDLSDIFTHIADVGSNGSGLTALPWNASWDAEVQSEADDALVANRLDHLLLQAVSGTDVTDNSVIAKMVSKSVTADWDSFDNTTDSQEALSDNAVAIDAADIRAAMGLAEANLDEQLDALPTTAEVATPEEIGEEVVEQLDGNIGQNQPRINREPDPGFTTQVSRRADGTYKCTKPIRLTAGAVDQVYVFIDMSPLFGPKNFVETVGTPTVSGGSVAASAEGPRDTYAVVELDGTATAGEERTVTVPVTMTSGTTLNVVFDVEVLE